MLGGSRAADVVPAASIVMTAIGATSQAPEIPAGAAVAAAAAVPAAAADAAAAPEALALALTAAAATDAQEQQARPAAAHSAARSRLASTWAGRAPSGRCSWVTAALQPAAARIATMMHPCTVAGGKQESCHRCQQETYHCQAGKGQTGSAERNVSGCVMHYVLKPPFT